MRFSTNYKKILHKFIVISIVLVTTGTILIVVREIIHVKKKKKKFIIKSGMYRMSYCQQVCILQMVITFMTDF